MKIIINTSTFKESSDDPSPNFINKLVEDFSKKNNFYIIYPRKTNNLKSKFYSKNIFLLPYSYIFPKKLSNLSNYGLYPAIKKNKLNVIKVVLLIFFQFINLLYYSIKLRPDIIYNHWLFPQGFIGALVGKLLNIKTVFTSHGSDVKLLNNSGSIGKLITNFTVNNSDSFTAVSKTSLNTLKTSIKNNSRDLNCKIIPMGVDENFFEKINQHKVKENNLTNFLYFGRMIDYKGVDLIIDAVLRLREKPEINFHINLIGSGVDFNKIQNKIKSYNLQKFVKLINFVERNELIKFIDNSEFIIVPSKITKNEYEAGPLSLVEAMARKKVCIVSNSIGFIDFINDESAIIFESNNADDLFNKMLEALSLNEKKRTEIGNKAFKISENFKYRIISKKTEEFLF